MVLPRTWACGMSQSDTRGGECAKRPAGESWDIKEVANDGEAPASRVPLHEALEMPDAVDLARPALASEAPPHVLASDLTGLHPPGDANFGAKSHALQWRGWGEAVVKLNPTLPATQAAVRAEFN